MRSPERVRTLVFAYQPALLQSKESRSSRTAETAHKVCKAGNSEGCTYGCAWYCPATTENKQANTLFKQGGPVLWNPLRRQTSTMKLCEL